MTTLPATYTLVVPNRADLSETIRVPYDGTGASVFASVWDSEARRRKLLDLTVTWVDRYEEYDPLDLTKIRATLTLSATWEQTRAVTQDGFWDLLWVWPDDIRFYVLEGPAIVNPGLSEEVAP